MADGGFLIPERLGRDVCSPIRHLLANLPLLRRFISHRVEWRNTLDIILEKLGRDKLT